VRVDWVIDNVHLATLQAGASEPYGHIAHASLAVADGRIVWQGPRRLLNSAVPRLAEATVIDGNGGWLTPGLVDCHTHLIYAGHRADEFEMRMCGQTYQQIAQHGGGIQKTMRLTRAASDDELFNAAAQRLQRLLREGVTTVEIKSGYGLDVETELRMLRVAKELGRRFPVTVRTTFLGAHALPPEYQGRRDDYVRHLCNAMLPAVAAQQLADAVDVFCEGIAFSVEECRQIFSAARALGLPVKGHVEQLSYRGGARLVASFDGLSVDHIEYLPVSDIKELQAHATVAVLLPGSFYFLRETRRPPIAALRQARIPMAVATDLNPGTSPLASLLFAMNQACVLFALTPQEALAGATRHAAAALGLGERKGQLQVGYDADLLLWDIEHPAQLSYGINMHRPQAIWVGGQRV
jgi:imidazolonepropionase